MKNAGRPTIFTRARADRIVDAIRRGLPYKLAASAGGISFNTFVRWRNAGSQPDAPQQLRVFCNQVRSAEAEAAQRLLGLVEAAAERDWKAASWMLSKRYPEIFGKETTAPRLQLGYDEAEIFDED